MVMKLIDVHAHMESSRFEEDLDEVMDRAEKAGVKIILSSGVNPETNRKTLELAKKYEIVKASLGLYPIDSVADKFDNLADDYLRKIPKFNVDEELEFIKENKDNILAVGEIGLDFKVIKELGNVAEIKIEQEKVFRKVLELAKEIQKPVIIHSRGAEERCIEILKELKTGKVVMHCFNGRKSLIKEGIEAGFYFSVPPVITRLNHFEMLVELVPVEKLLTETDAPYLSPVAGERNEPANVAVTIKRIAEIKGLSEEDVAEQIFKNAEDLFDL
ncbi:TatD family hydrolase [archaeon]|nr:TatD family hydrolase [archaeon]